MGKIKPTEMFSRFRGRFWLPPRPHGEIIEDRTVSFLELFYDLTFVVLIARAAHTLAHHVSWQGFWEFVVVFGLIWVAWLNGTIHHELHGREDGRSRSFIFLQMLLLGLLAVFTADATGEGGSGFAVVYAALLAVLTWLWYTVRRVDSPEWMQVTGRYLAGMLASIVIMFVSIFLDEGPRTILWGVFILAWILGTLLQSRTGTDMGSWVTDSMVERFGLFTIIVLGEVVVGVVDGLSEAERNLETVATGLFGLILGFGFWWTYFDYVGRRLPRAERAVAGYWILGHFPVALSIAAAGAAMVSLIEHASDEAAPAATAWLLSGSVGLLLLAMVWIMRQLRAYDQFPDLYRPVMAGIGVGVAVALLVGWWRPAPWLLVLSLAAIHSIIWFFAFDRWLRLDEAATADV